MVDNALMIPRRRAAWFISCGGLALGQAFFLLLPPPFLTLGFFLIPLYYVSRRLTFGHWIPHTRANPLVLILLAMTAIGFGISSARDLAVFSVAPLLAGITLFFYLTDVINTPRDLQFLTRALALIGLVIALGTPFKTDPGTSPLLGSLAFAIYAMVPRVSNIANSNDVAGGLAILAPFALAVMVQKNWAWRILGGVAFVAMGFATVLLDSRGALFALALGLAVWGTLYRRWVLPLFPLGLIALLVLNQTLSGPSVSDLVLGKIGTPKGGTINERQEMWVQAAQMIRTAPIFGIGLGAYPRIAPITSPYSPSFPGAVNNHTHNTFFQIALDTGVPGAVAFIALLFSVIYFGWRAYRRGTERDVAIAVLAASTILIAHGLGDTVVWGTAKTGLIFWILASVGISFDKASKVV